MISVTMTIFNKEAILPAILDALFTVCSDLLSSVSDRPR